MIHLPTTSHIRQLQKAVVALGDLSEDKTFFVEMNSEQIESINKVVDSYRGLCEEVTIIFELDERVTSKSILTSILSKADRIFVLPEGANVSDLISGLNQNRIILKSRHHAS